MWQYFVIPFGVICLILIFACILLRCNEARFFLQPKRIPIDLMGDPNQWPHLPPNNTVLH